MYKQFAGKIALLNLNIICIASSLKVHYVADLRDNRRRDGILSPIELKTFFTPYWRVQRHAAAIK
jgi:hypothetical protein